MPAFSIRPALPILLGCYCSWLLLVALIPGLLASLLDHPNERSSHPQPTPRGGGVAFVLVALLASALSCFDTRDIPSESRVVASLLMAIRLPWRVFSTIALTCPPLGATACSSPQPCWLSLQARWWLRPSDCCPSWRCGCSSHRCDELHKLHGRFGWPDVWLHVCGDDCGVHPAVCALRAD